MKKILVVNNDVETMSLLKSWLEKKTYTVKYTSSHDDVPAIMKEFTPHLVIVDVIQKEVVGQLKLNKKTSGVPVLLMTGYALRALNNQVPVDDMIEKPFNLDLLEQKIHRLTQKIV